MKRVRTRLGAMTAAMALGATALASFGGTAQALSNPTHPQLSLNRTLSSHPFPGAPSNASDIEGLAYVPSDTSMWVADDNADRIWEINAVTGAYKSQLKDGVSLGTDFHNATKVGTGETCATYVDPLVVGDTPGNECLSRTDDFESIVYDPSGDVLYVTSGGCCTAGLPVGYPMHPTVWKLTRDVSGHFVPSQWQALDEGQDPTAAGWRPGSGMYYGKGTKVGPYTFGNTARDSTITLPLSNIVGLDFVDSSTVFVTTSTPSSSTSRTTGDSDSTIHRFNISGSTWTEDTAWKFPLQNTGVIDARDLSIVGDSFYVSDGYDFRSNGEHPIYVFTLGEATLGGYIVDGYGGLHTYSPSSLTPAPSGGPYWKGWDIARGVAVLPDNSGGYVLDGYGGLHPFGLGGHAAPAAPLGGPYWKGWDIARGVTFTSNGKGGYIVDGYGGLHTFKVGSSGTTPVAGAAGPYWKGWDIARGVAITGNGGYVLDGYGGTHTFKIGSGGTAPAAVVGGPYWQGWDITRGLTIVGNGGYIVDGYGGTHTFKIGSGGTAPAAVVGGPYWQGWDITRGIGSVS